jgi:uncharacterized protein
MATQRQTLPVLPHRWHQHRSERRRLASLGVLVGAAVALSAALGTAHAQAESKSKVAFVGDSTADGMWGGVTRLIPRNACLKGNAELGRFAKNSTGLTRPEKFNWVDELKKIGDSFKPQVFVMSLGLNDRQSVVVGGKVIFENSPEYPAKYKERVAAVLKSAVASKAHLLWIGLPAMRDAAPDKDAREKNRFFAEAVAEFGDPSMQYVEPWKLNPAAAEDKFASFGPDETGKMIQIRASDGGHFTPAGELLVAAYLLPKIIATLAKSGVKLGEACAS